MGGGGQGGAAGFPVDREGHRSVGYGGGGGPSRDDVAEEFGAGAGLGEVGVGGVGGDGAGEEAEAEFGAAGEAVGELGKLVSIAL